MSPTRRDVLRASAGAAMAVIAGMPAVTSDATSPERVPIIADVLFDRRVLAANCQMCLDDGTLIALVTHKDEPAEITVYRDGRDPVRLNDGRSTAFTVLMGGLGYAILIAYEEEIGLTPSEWSTR